MMDIKIGSIKSSKTGREFIEKVNQMACTMGIRNYMVIAEGYAVFSGSPFNKAVEENAEEYRNEGNLANCDFDDVATNIDLERSGCFELKRFFINGVRINVMENIPAISIVINGRVIAFLQFFKHEVRIHCATNKGDMDMERYRLVQYSTRLSEVDWTAQFGVNGNMISQILHHIAWARDWRMEKDATAPREVRACDLKLVYTDPKFIDLCKYTTGKSGSYDLNRISHGLQVHILEKYHILEITMNGSSVAFVKFEPEAIRIHPANGDDTMDFRTSLQANYESHIRDCSYTMILSVDDARLVRQILAFIASYEQWEDFGRGGK